MAGAGSPGVKGGGVDLNKILGVDSGGYRRDTKASPPQYHVEVVAAVRLSTTALNSDHDASASSFVIALRPGCRMVQMLSAKSSVMSELGAWPDRCVQ